MKFNIFVLLAIFTLIIFSCSENKDLNIDNTVTTDGCVERFDWSGSYENYAPLKLKDSNTRYVIDMCCDQESMFWSSELEGDLKPGACYRIIHEKESNNRRRVISAKIIQKANQENFTEKQPKIIQKDVRPQPFLNPEDIPDIKPNTKPLIIIIEDGNDKKIMQEFKDTLKKYEDNLESDRAKLEESNI